MNDQELAQQLRTWSEPESGHRPASGPEIERGAGPRPGLASAPDRRPTSAPEIEDRHDSASDPFAEPAPRLRGRRILALAAIIPVVLIIAGAIAVNVTRTPDQSVSATLEGDEAPSFTPGPCPVPAPRPTDLTAEDAKAASEREVELVYENIEEGKRTGFEKFSAPTQDGGYMCGWVRVDNKDPNVPGLPIFRDADGGQDLYDAIDGTVVGVAYPYLGFFDLETVAAANFNPTALRVERYGCDPVHDRGCKR